MSRERAYPKTQLWGGPPGRLVQEQKGNILVSSGHVWQGRFKAFPVQNEDHLLTVIRYLERNPLRANLVKQAELWPWSSLAWRVSGKRPEILADWPIACPAGMAEACESAAIRSGRKGTATGDRALPTI